MKKKHPHFLLTNDDGIQADGIAHLAGALEEFGRVTLIAPDSERSGVSHAFSLHGAQRLVRYSDSRYSLSGTPADCVMFGLRHLLMGADAPDYVFSGINHGANLGTDVVYSGTAAGAREGAIFKKPSVAVSLATEFSSRFDAQHMHFETPVAFLRNFIPQLLSHQVPPGFFLNINVPNIPPEHLKGGCFTRIGNRIYRDTFYTKTDKEGHEYVWLGGEPPTHTLEEGTDFHALDMSMASVTPVRWMMSDAKDVVFFKDWQIAGELES